MKWSWIKIIPFHFSSWCYKIIDFKPFFSGDPKKKTSTCGANRPPRLVILKLKLNSEVKNGQWQKCLEFCLCLRVNAPQNLQNPYMRGPWRSSNVLDFLICESPYQNMNFKKKLRSPAICVHLLPQYSGQILERQSSVCYRQKRALFAVFSQKRLFY